MTQDTQTIWKQVHDGLRAFVAKRVANEAEVDDILQEVFLRMHRKLEGLDDPRRVVSWLYQIARHVIVDHYRRPARRREVPAGLAGDVDRAYPTAASDPLRASGEAAQHRTELAACLRPMIAHLAVPYREAVTLVELDGMTQQAAATRLGLSLSGVKSRVQRGRRQLKAMLEACCTIQLDARRGVADYAPRESACSPCGPRLSHPCR